MHHHFHYFHQHMCRLVSHPGFITVVAIVVVAALILRSNQPPLPPLA